LDKIQIIEKLFNFIVTYSYLTLPLAFLLLGKHKFRVVPTALAIYGVACFIFLRFYPDTPKSLHPYFQTLYTIFEYLVFTFIFWNNIENRKFKRFMAIASVAFAIFQVFYLLSGQIRRLDTVPIGIETILVFTYILYFFYESSKNVGNLYIYNQYAFWISVGILIYLGGSFFFFILIDHLSRDEVTTFGNMTYLAEAFKNLLFAVALFIYTRYPVGNHRHSSAAVPYLDMI